MVYWDGLRPGNVSGPISDRPDRFRSFFRKIKISIFPDVFNIFASKSKLFEAKMMVLGHMGCKKSQISKFKPSIKNPPNRSSD